MISVESILIYGLNWPLSVNMHNLTQTRMIALLVTKCTENLASPFCSFLLGYLLVRIFRFHDMKTLKIHLERSMKQLL